MAEHEVSRKELAAKLDCSFSQLTRWRKSLAKPDRMFATKLERLTGGAVTVSMWDE